MIPSPMLAHTYTPGKSDKDVFPCFVQPKLDGIRCLAMKDDSEPRELRINLWSRNGKTLWLPHLILELQDFFSVATNIKFLDGELYVHGKSFQDVASLVKRANHPLQEMVKYHIYDRQFRSPWEDRRFADRFYDFKLLSSKKGKYNHIVQVPTHYAKDKQAADIFHAKWVGQGYEGSMLRTGYCDYEEGKRSRDLLKRKDWHEDEFIVTEVKEGRGKNSGTAVFTCRAGENVFDVTAPGTYKQKAKFFNDKYVGKYLTVKYQNLTDAGIPRFPIAIGFKEDR